jgi:dolichol-phosphate mannosyltransferase
MLYALKNLRPEIIFQFDADLQHDPDKIPEMLAKIREGNDLVLGSRYIPGGGIPANWGLKRKFLSIVGNWTIRAVITVFSIHDRTTGYRAIRKHVVEQILPELNEERFMGYTFQIGFLHKAVRRGFKIAEVPFIFKDRKIGHSKLGSEYIKNTLIYIFKIRLKEITSSRIFKFIVVGALGAVVQLTTLQLFRQSMPYQLAYFFSVELAVVSNFILSNLWTFADRKLRFGQIPLKFIQFNLASMGSIVIQQIFAYMGEKYVGLYPLFSIPVVGWGVDTGLLFAVTGILLGMIWNFTAYNRIIWRHKKA